MEVFQWSDEVQPLMKNDQGVHIDMMGHFNGHI
jgi:hypothetical protein